MRPGHDLRCTDYPELFFAESPGEIEAAKALCRECPVRAACLAGALKRREPWGVWGGEVFLEGAIVPRKRPRGRPRKTDVAARELAVTGNELPPSPAGLRALVPGFERNPKNLTAALADGRLRAAQGLARADQDISIGSAGRRTTRPPEVAEG